MTRLLTVVFLLLALCALAHSQSVYVGVGAGYSSMTPLAAHNFLMYDRGFAWKVRINSVEGQTSDKGFSLICDLKLEIPEMPLRLVGGASYARLYGKTDSATATTPPLSSLGFESGGLESQLSLVSLNAGIEWDVVRPVVTPYLSLNFLFNHFGRTDIKIINPFRTAHWTVDAESRGGLAFGGGLRSTVLRSLAIDLGADFALQNIVGRKEGESLRNGFAVRFVLLYQLF